MYEILFLISVLLVIVIVYNCYCTHSWKKLQSSTDKWTQDVVNDVKKKNNEPLVIYYTMRKCRKCGTKQFYFGSKRGWVTVAWLPDAGVEINVESKK